MIESICDNDINNNINDDNINDYDNDDDNDIIDDDNNDDANILRAFRFHTTSRTPPTPTLPGSSFRRSQYCARAEERRARRINVRAEEMRARRINALAE